MCSYYFKLYTFSLLNLIEVMFKVVYKLKFLTPLYQIYSIHFGAQSITRVSQLMRLSAAATH